MSVFRIEPVSRNGAFIPAWFDDATATWKDERLRREAPLARDWKPPQLRLWRPECGATPVLYNPEAIAVSGALRDRLSPFEDLEFLPVLIDGSGEWFILRVVTVIDVPVGSDVHANPVSGNITVFRAFPDGWSPPTAFFRLRQPRSAAGHRVGACLFDVFADAAGARAIEESCEGYLTALEVRRDETP